MLASTSRALSPTQSVISSTQGASSPVQIKKVVLEGRSKHDGASLRMYLKLSVAVDHILPGASMPLFPEHNIRITQSKVHPLDERSVPYHFVSNEQPLLHKTAVALQLGPKSSRSYLSLFPHGSPPLDPGLASTSRRSRDNTSSNSVSPLNEERYTGHIVVSGYNVTLVLPKEFPPRPQSTGPTAESDGDEYVKDLQSPWSSRNARRSSLFFNKHYFHVMIGLEAFVPYVLTPPKGPFLISIPVPRCLDNHLKLRISTPPIGTTTVNTPRGSFTSTSSEDDMPGWDFLTDPPVSRRVDKPQRKSSYHQSADDEHSDTPSAPSTPGTELIQGAYQSTDVVHVRWAPPLSRRSSVPKTEDGMRRVGIERTVGKMKCEVLGRDRYSVRLGIAYEGICTGLWHPGVATVLGMDLALDVKGRRFSWAEDGVGWTVSGKEALVGLYSEASPPNALSRKLSFDSTPSSTFLSTLASRSVVTPARGSASLLRAPLPSEGTPDYSFETTPNTTPAPSGSSSNPVGLTAEQETRMSRPDVSPGKPVTLKVNLLKLLPPAKNELSFTVRGTVLVDVEEEDFVPLPTFRVLGSDKERFETAVSTQTADAIVQVGAQLPNTPRRTLRAGDEVRCEEGVGLVLRPWESPARPTTTPSASTSPSMRPKKLHVEAVPNAAPARLSHAPRLPHLSCVLTTVTPLLNSPQTHCVRVNIPVYSLDADSIEFGLALPRSQRSSVLKGTLSADIDVLYATYAGRQVHVEVIPQDGPSMISSTAGLPEGSQIIGETQYLVVVHLEDVEADAGAIEIVYLAGGEDGVQLTGSAKDQGKSKEGIGVDILLPCFQLPVARYEVEVDCPSNLIPHVENSTLSNHHITQTKAPRLVHYRLPAGFFPALSLSFTSSSESNLERRRSTKRWRFLSAAYSVLTYLSFLVLVYSVVSIGIEVRQVRDTMHGAARALAHGVPFSDMYWGGVADPFGNQRPWTQDPFVPPMSSETSTASSTTSSTSWQRETVSPVTPAIDLSTATPVMEKRPPRVARRESRSGALVIPLPAVPFLSWKLPISFDTKDFIVKGLMKAWYVIRKVWNFPVDPD